MNLIVDQGNTATKLTIFDDKKNVVERCVFAKDEIETTEKWIENHSNSIKAVLVSSVTNEKLKISIKKRIDFDASTPLPIGNGYGTPKTLGRYRLANAVAIWSRNPGNASLAIDFGTCIKYDLVSSEGIYLGGNISPGLHMRYRALHEFTDQLPLIEPEEFDYAFGISTKSSIQNGVQQAIFHEINGFIQRYTAQFNGLTIFMTGGDLNFFDKGFKSSIFALPIVWKDLTSYGLNEILSYNVEI